MQLPEPDPNVHLDQITGEEARSFLSQGVWQEDPALRLVLNDLHTAESHTLSKMWVLGVEQSLTLYQSPYEPRYWAGTQVEAASIPLHTVATSVNGMVPQALGGLFYENPPFMIQEHPGTTAQAARATQALMAYQLQDINFNEEVRLGSVNCILFGTSIYQYGWETYEKKRKVVKRKTPAAVIQSTIPGAPPTRISSGELEVVEETEKTDRPVFEHIVNLKEVFVDPSLNVPDIRKAKYVIRRRYMTWNDLDKLRDREGYDIPSREKLLELFMPPIEQVEPAVSESGQRNPAWDTRPEPRYETVTINPFEQPLEVLERWDNDTYIVVLQQKLTIYNDRNIYGKIPFYSVNWWDVPMSFFGLGQGQLVGSEQRLQQGTNNLLLDFGNLVLTPTYTRVRGKSIPTQSIRLGPGKIIEVENKDDIQPLSRPAAIPEAAMIMSMSQGRVEQVGGTNPINSLGQAGASGHSNLARSSAGAQLIGQGGSTPASEYVDKFCRQVFIPFLYDLQEMNQELLSEDQLTYILSDELKHEFMQSGADVLDVLNARVKFDVLAGAKMQARRNMAQALPLLTQFLSNPEVTSQLAIEGKKIDIMEVCRMYFESSDWKNVNNVIIPMTPQDLQRQQAQSQAAIANSKGAQQQTLQQQKFQQQQQLADNENIARAARDVLREAFKKSVEPEELTGEPGASVGFGSSV